LLAGTASVALGLAAGQPFADPTIKLGIQSYAEQGFVKQDHDKGNFVGFRDRVTLDFVASNTTDNGLRYGARLRIRTLGAGSTGTGGTGFLDYDKGFVFVGSAFGNVLLGSNTGVTDIARILAPNDWGTFAAIDGDYANWINSIGFRSDENPVSAGVNSRVTYFSPGLAGVQLGVAYTPSSAARGQSSSAPKPCHLASLAFPRPRRATAMSTKSAATTWTTLVGSISRQLLLRRRDGQRLDEYRRS
jgi:hypothetical protein